MTPREREKHEVGGGGETVREDEGTRRLVEGEPAAHGGRSPTRSLAPAPGLRGGGGSWHPPGNQLGQVPAASAARATPSLASSPPRLALAAAASLRGNYISVSKWATVVEEASRL